MILPEALSETIRRTRPRERAQLRVSNSAFYADTMTVDSFNDFIALRISLLRGQYGYVEAEHEDWVCSNRQHSEYVVLDEAYEGEKVRHTRKEVRLLDSWTLKMPVSFVPREDQLHEEMEWRDYNRPLLGRLHPHVRAVEQLQEAYITAACLDVKTHEVLLKKWTECKRPVDQKEAASCEGLPFFREKARQQLTNMLDAAQTLQNLSGWNAPNFMMERASGRLCMEEKIHTQIKYAMRLYR